VRQYRRELKEQILDLLTASKEQSHKLETRRTPEIPSAPEPQYETSIEQIPGTEHEVKRFGEDIFVPGDVVGYKDMVAFRRPQTHEYDGFENDVIRRACQIGVFKPSPGAVRRFPELAIRVQNDDEMDADNSFDHEQQSKSIREGGMGQMQFIGAGWACNPRTGRMTPRQTNNFSGMRNLGGPSGKGSGPDGGSFGGDLGEVDMPADFEGDES
jgi:hypothetical protein